MNNKFKYSVLLNGFLFLLFCTSSVSASAPPPPVQNAQMIYDSALTRFVASWDEPAPGTVVDYHLSYFVEQMSLSAVGGDDVYGYEVEMDFESDYDESDIFSGDTTEIVMFSPPDEYGKLARASITPRNADGSGSPETVELKGIVQPPGAPSGLDYEIREDDLVAYFFWDAASTAGIPSSLDIYYKVEYVSDSGVSDSTFYSSNFAALDLTADQYWDYSVSVCVYDQCGDATTIRAELTTRQVPIVESGFESGIPSGWTTTGGFWQVESGPAPSTSTGPASAATGSSYLRFNSSPPAGLGDTAILESPNFNPVDSRLYFSYHMYGATMGTLYVDVYEDGWNTIWQQSGQQHATRFSAWTDVEIDLSAYESDMKVRFRGVDGSGALGDMALDDISVTAVISTIGGLAAEYSVYPVGLKLTWNEESTAISYDIARSTNSGASWDENYASVSNAEFIDTDVENTSLIYSYRVRHCNNEVCSNWSSSPWVQE